MQSRSTARLLALGALAFAAGCDGDDDTTGTGTQTARVRVVNLLPAASSAGLFANGTAAGSGVSFGSAGTSCVDVPVGQTLAFRAGGGTADLASNANAGLTAGQQYTIVLFGSGTGGATPRMVILSDNGVTAPTAGNNALRFFNATGTAGDVWVTAPGGSLTGTPSAGNVGAGQGTSGTSAFGSYPTGSTQVRLFGVGSTTGTPAVTTTIGANSLSATRVGTVFLTNAALTGGGNASVVSAPCS